MEKNNLSIAIPLWLFFSKIELRKSMIISGVVYNLYVKITASTSDVAFLFKKIKKKEIVGFGIVVKECFTQIS